MAKYFLGSVGKAEAFRIQNGELTLAFVSKTLTDSGLNISTTKDDIRGGTGAPIQFSFYHDTNVEINLTDIQWKHEYLEAQLGAYMDGSTAEKREDYITDTLVASSGKLTLKKPVKSLQVPCLKDDPYVVWYALQGDDNWVAYTSKSAFTEIADANLVEGKNYCVRYLAAEDRAVSAEITSLIVPQELYLIITAPLFAGDACAASDGKAAGHITFEVPRFQLNGAQEFSMNMSSNQTMSLAGIALASESIDCDQEGGKLLRIIEVINDRDIKKFVVSLESDEESEVAGSEPVIFGITTDGSAVQLDNSKDLTFTPALTNGKYAASTTYSIAFKDDTTVPSISVEIGAGE